MQLVHAMGITVLTGCGVASQRAGVQPYLGARTRSGDMMGDRVPAGGGCGRSFYVGRPRQVRDGRSIREPAAPHQRSRCPARTMATGSGGGWELGGDQGLVAELTQGVVGLAGELASHRQRGPLAAQPLFDLEVVGVVGGARAGGAHGRLV